MYMRQLLVANSTAFAAKCEALEAAERVAAASTSQLSAVKSDAAAAAAAAAEKYDALRATKALADAKADSNISECEFDDAGGGDDEYDDNSATK